MPSPSIRPKFRGALVAAALVVLLAALPRAAGAIDAPEGKRQWAIWFNEQKIGLHVMTFHHMGGKLIVDSEIYYNVPVAVVWPVRYLHRDQEVWRGGRLVEFAADTNDRGVLAGVDLEETAAGPVLDAEGGKRTPPANLVPSSLWTIDMTKGQPVLDAESGRVLAVRFSEGAREPLAFGAEDMPARHVSASGELVRELWYGDDGLLVRQQMKNRKGELLDFRLDSGRR